PEELRPAGERSLCGEASRLPPASGGRGAAAQHLDLLRELRRPRELSGIRGEYRSHPPGGPPGDPRAGPARCRLPGSRPRLAGGVGKAPRRRLLVRDLLGRRDPTLLIDATPPRDSGRFLTLRSGEC